MARITVEDCVEVVPNRFELCLIASNRAKAILSGSSTDLDRKEKPAVIALREIASDLIDVDSQRKNIINSIKNSIFSFQGQSSSFPITFLILENLTLSYIVFNVLSIGKS